MGNGTRMTLARFWPVGTESFVTPDSNCQTPFKFIQFDRAICGRGYSGRTFVGFTCWAQSVINGACFGCHGIPPIAELETARSMELFAAFVISSATIPLGKEPTMKFPLPVRELYCTSGN